MLGLLSPKNHSKSLLGALPYGCKIQEQFSPGSHSSAMAAVVFLVIEKSSSQMFFLFLMPLMRLYIVKMTMSRPKIPCPQRI
jgi:hypothetical protein